MQNELSIDFPDTVRAERLPLVFDVAFASTAGCLPTQEGEVSFEAGAAIVTGVKGEQWPIAPARFEASYLQLEGVTPGERGQYRRRPQTVLAHRLTAPYALLLSNNRGSLSGQINDWLVEYSPGDRAIVAADIFDKTYVIIEEHNR